MNTKNHFFKKLTVYGAAAAFLFALPACDNAQQGAVEDDGLVEEEAVADEGLVENDYTQLSERGYYTTLDADRSGELNELEFRQNWEASFEDEEYNEDLFSEWDLNANAGLDENEWRTGLWDFYDEDNSLGLNENEFNRVVRVYYINRWDTDNNNTIAETEFREGWNTYMSGKEYDSSLFGEWDTNDDGLLDDKEYATGMFGYWDEDDSGVLEEGEYRAFYL